MKGNTIKDNLSKLGITKAKSQVYPLPKVELAGSHANMTEKRGSNMKVSYIVDESSRAIDIEI